MNIDEKLRGLTIAGLRRRTALLLAWARMEILAALLKLSIKWRRLISDMELRLIN